MNTYLISFLFLLYIAFSALSSTIIITKTSNENNINVVNNSLLIDPKILLNNRYEIIVKKTTETFIPYSNVLLYKGDRYSTICSSNVTILDDIESDPRNDFEILKQYAIFKHDDKICHLFGKQKHKSQKIL